MAWAAAGEASQAAHETTPVDTAAGPAEIVRRYYDGIQARDYDAAYALWGDSGTYTLRRAMVDGATPEQRRWHIYSANVR